MPCFTYDLKLDKVIRMNPRAQKKVVHPEFARRMELACDGNPDIPPPNYGRLGWFVTQFEDRFHQKITIETVRKWFAGETLPRPKAMAYLAQIMGVDLAWLSLGKHPEMTVKQHRLRNAEADGAVNVVAGFIQMAGGHPAFPAADDPRTNSEKVDLYAVIRGAQYAFHIALGTKTDNGWHFAVPIEAVNLVIIGVMHTGPLQCEFVELDAEGVERIGKRKSGFYEVLLPTEGVDHEWRQITNFGERF